LQNGPGAFVIKDVVLNHLFDGMAMLHRFNIADGKVTYQCRFVDSNAYKKIKAENKVMMGEFGTAPKNPGSFFSRFLSLFQSSNNEDIKNITDNTSVAIYPFDRDYFAVTESPVINKFDPKTLETLHSVSLNNGTGIITQTAHPLIDEDGQVYNVGMGIVDSNVNYVIFCVPKGDEKFENIKVLAQISPQKPKYPSYMHSFGMTKNYFVIVEQPLFMPMLALLKMKLFNDAFMSVLKWFPNELTYIKLIDRKTGKVLHSYQTDTFFFFHTINAYEDDDSNHVVLDLSCYRSSELINSFKVEKLKNKNFDSGTLHTRPLRFVMPLRYLNEPSTKNLVTLNGSTATAYLLSNGLIYCMPELLCDKGCEFGTIYYAKHLGKMYQYFYAVELNFDRDNFGRLLKVDVLNKTHLEWYEENIFPSESIFVPSPNAKSEDDGVLLAALLRGGGNDKNYVGLLVLDAKTFKEIGRCEFKNLPGSIPKTFHGWFMDDNN
jgi:carotenoid isomerooxygenase